MYAITYFDPLDEEGMRVRTWVFRTREEAEGWRRELEVVWRVLVDEINVYEICENEVRKIVSHARASRLRGLMKYVGPHIPGLTARVLRGKRARAIWEPGGERNSVSSLRLFSQKSRKM